ncbi:MAG: class I SAM-dependent methyltransferase [Armatimonadota bacterium]|nr:class I SAM-dependent methyltransferase [Armatimonadota bacterium]
MGAYGWSGVGLDPDARAVSAARQAGLMVHHGILTPGRFPAGHFDAITLNHVVEHLHDPVETLRVCHEILAPEGALWIATPNLEALGHRRFGENWRGLEPPRHLVLFTPTSLVGALERLGFRVEAGPLPCWNARWFFEVSTEITQGHVPSDAPALPKDIRRTVRRQAQWANLCAWRRPALGEELIVLARRRP